jgi:cell division protein FtsQ
MGNKAVGHLGKKTSLSGGGVMRIHGKIQQGRGVPARKGRIRHLSLKTKLYGVLFLVVVASLVLFSKKLSDVLQQVTQSAQTFQKDTGLTVQEVLVEGRSKTSRKNLLKTAQIQFGLPILSLSLEDIHKKILTLPWVKKVRVERHLPDLIILRLQEYEPYALWQNNGKLALISKDETVLKIPDPERYVHLPKVIGRGALKKVKPFFESLKTFPKVWQNLLYATYIGKRRWSVVLKNKTRIDFPEFNYEKSLEKLRQYDLKHRALERFRVIDLRLPDKVTVRK